MNIDQPTEESIQRFVKQLQRIAKINKDKFDYKIEIISFHPSIQYRFVCQESTDNHEFLTGIGPTIELAILDAAKDVKEACKLWVYKFIE